MLSLKKLCFLCILGLTISIPAVKAQSHETHWQEAKAITGNFKAVSSQHDIEIFSSPNVIMLKVNHDVEVRLFTILGKLISADYLHPGIYQYHLDAHGIYIIKTEETSCKVAI